MDPNYQKECTLEVEIYSYNHYSLLKITSNCKDIGNGLPCSAYTGDIYILCLKEEAEFDLSATFYFTKIGAAVPKLWVVKGKNPTHSS